MVLDSFSTTIYVGQQPSLQWELETIRYVAYLGAPSKRAATLAATTTGASSLGAIAAIVVSLRRRR
jgi:hypothetical protein